MMYLRRGNFGEYLRRNVSTVSSHLTILPRISTIGIAGNPINRTNGSASSIAVRPSLCPNTYDKEINDNKENQNNRMKVTGYLGFNSNIKTKINFSPSKNIITLSSLVDTDNFSVNIRVTNETKEKNYIQLEP